MQHPHQDVFGALMRFMQRISSNDDEDVGLVQDGMHMLFFRQHRSQ